MITATALVLFMTLPGLAYSTVDCAVKDVLSILAHCFAIACLASIIWFAVGYSLALTAEAEKPGSGNRRLFPSHLSIEN